jgi:glucose-6-phosphate 1-dehydrogenase
MRTPSTLLVIFGASGDLMRRKLGPALFRLFRKGRLPPCAGIVGFAQSEMDDDGFRTFVRESLEEFVPDVSGAEWEAFAPMLSYVTGDLEDPASYQALRRRLEGMDGGGGGKGPGSTGTEDGSGDAEEPSPHRVYYLAIAPRFFPEAVRRLGEAGLGGREAGGRRLVIEKPFGRDGGSARSLNEIVHSVFLEDQVYRIDHYLAKETAQNLLYFRFANAIFEPIWNRTYVDNVQITVSETVDVEHRAGYYDRAGVLRDMFQNHLLQLFTLVAMEPPAPFNARTLRDEKVKVLAATRGIALDDTVCAQYDGYCGTPDVAPGSRTPTYAAMRLLVDNWRWEGVPFYLRSGKALEQKSSSISIEFKRPPHRLFGAFQSPAPNVLTLCIQPDEGVHLMVDAKVPDQAAETRPVDLEFHYRTAFGGDSLPEAYERLLQDALEGDASLFARSDEIEAAWALMDPVIRRWESGDGDALPLYAPGSEGPGEAEALLARDGRRWRPGCADH